MKLSFFTLIMVLFAANECSYQEQHNIDIITYETFTRGSSTMYTVSPESIKIKGTGINAGEKSGTISNQDWKSLLEVLSKVDASRLNQLKAPSDSRASDAALHAILSVRKNDTIYKTNSFDHGNAPITVKPLVEAILRLAENVE